MRPRMVDVAQRAGVSVATVSRVLNKTKHVEPDIERAVWRAVEALGFTPNQHARWLSSGRSNVVGVVMPASEDSNRSRFLHALANALRPHDYEVMVALSEGERGGERELVRTLLQSHVSALVVASPSIDARLRTVLADGGVPTILAFNRDPRGKIPAVTFDDRAAAEALASAIPYRHERVAILSHGEGEQSIVDRVDGLSAIAADRLGVTPEVYNCDGSIDDAHRAALDLLEATRPTLLNATSDYLAIAAIRAAHDLGLAVPDHLRVTGFGINHYSFSAQPSLTTVQIDGARVGEICGAAAAQMLGGGAAPTFQRVGFELVAGESCPLTGEDGAPWLR